MDTIELKSKIRKGSKNQTEREFQDFIVNGKSLYEMFGEPDLVGAIGSFGKEVNIEAVNLLLLNKNSELNSKRIPIYICPECGDLGCGAITISIIENDKSFIWSSFGYENNYQDELLKEYKEVGPFRFQKEEYLKLFKKFV